jgi:hypothetical protein
MRAIRLDRHRLDGKATRLDNGWLRAPAHLTRTGVFEYRLGDGEVRRELRLPEEVFNADALASFNLVPLTDNHPYREPDGKLDAKNAKAYVVGSVGNARADGDLVAADVLVLDENAIAKIDAGTVELSCGYSAEVEEKPGVYTDAEGRHHPYDAIQRTIRGNHVALVPRGRAGPKARLRLDAADGEVIASDLSSTEPSGKAGGGTHVKFKIDGIEVEVPDTAAALIEKERKAHADALAAATAEAGKVKADANKATARADAAEAKVAELSTKLDAATKPEAIAAAVAARTAFETGARKVLGEAVKLDGKSDDEMRREVIGKAFPTIKLDGKSPEYVVGLFEAALAAPAAGTVENPATTEAARKLAEGKHDGADDGDPAAKMRAAIANAYAPAGK